MKESKVSVTNAGSGVAPGRKSGMLRVTVGDRGIYEIPLRVETDKGRWHAIHDGLLYSSEMQSDLRDAIKAAIETKEPVRWTRYIVIDYDAHSSGEWSRRLEIRGVRSDPAKQVVSTISLNWSVQDYSQPIRQGSGRLIRLHRFVWRDRNFGGLDGCGGGDYTDNVGQEQRTYDDKLPRGAVLYTADRIALLESIRDAFGKIHDRLAGMLDGDPMQIGEKMAAFLIPQLAAVSESDLREEARGLVANHSEVPKRSVATAKPAGRLVHAGRLDLEKKRKRT